MMEITYIHWVVLGLLLMGAELLLPGAFLIWIGTAAILVGIAGWFMPLSLPSSLVIFAILAPVMAIFGRTVFGGRLDEVETGTLNRRAENMVGRVLTLSAPIEDGRAKAIIGDSVWTVHGPDAPKGARVEVTAVEGNVLLVELVKK